ncbi:ABC transporter permease [Myroides odoratus]|uniref:ABC transporter permease n=1 Tax=Myroides odoratus TaxID=256 RepID=UPI0007659471|nr:ABC transporter permease [Myroides odoratus]
MARNKNSNTSIALRKFKKDFRGVLCFWVIIFFILVSVFAYFIIPDQSQHANAGDLAIRSKHPGFSTAVLVFPAPATTTWPEYWFGRKTPREQIPLLSHRITQDTLFYTPYTELSDLAQEKKLALASFSAEEKADLIQQKTFWLGTDNQGRDYYSRLVLGSRVSMAIGFIAVSISLIIGISLGAIAGYYGGKTDAFILWVINIFWSIPTLLLVIAITLALGKGFWQVFIAVGLTMWVEVARVVRGQVISVKQQQYITAARALGYSDYNIITRHILPNCMAPVIVISAANFASAILVESGLSFLGIGTQVPTPSWGAMIKENYNYILVGKAYLALLPGFAMFVIVMCFTQLGNAIRDAFDVRK